MAGVRDKGDGVGTAPEPTGAVTLSEERRRLLASQWGAMRRTLRRMDSLELEGTEPATLFVWASGEA